MNNSNNERNILYKQLRSKKGELIRLKNSYYDDRVVVEVGVLLFTRYDPPDNSRYFVLLTDSSVRNVAIRILHESTEKWFLVGKNNVEFL